MPITEMIATAAAAVSANVSVTGVPNLRANRMR